MQLYRKVTALTDLPPNEFIKFIRLSRAKDLLIKDFGNISEIGYEVGFNNPSYFAECFRKQFGCSPSEFKETRSSVSDK
jgi:AraC-like DNA-binding protein